MPGWPQPRTVVLHTNDGVRLVAEHHAAAALPLASLRSQRPVDGAPSLDIGCVVAHGFTGSARNPNVQRIVRGCSPRRASACWRRTSAGTGGRRAGHGRRGRDPRHRRRRRVAARRRLPASSPCSAGRWAARRCCVTPGSAATPTRSSASARPGCGASAAPGRCAIVHWMFEKRTGRAATRVLRRTRVSPHGVADAARGAGRRRRGDRAAPLLVVHGDADHYFPLRHVEALAAAAPAADVWIEPGMGHAEIGHHAGAGRAHRRLGPGRCARRCGPRRDAQVCDDGRRD